jgi:LSD1 subclass zinc finger protein
MTFPSVNITDLSQIYLNLPTGASSVLNCSLCTAGTYQTGSGQEDVVVGFSSSEHSLTVKDMGVSTMHALALTISQDLK